MDFRKVKNFEAQMAECGEFANKNIHAICEKFGPRECGSDAEKAAQLYMADLLKEYAAAVKREEFDVHPRAFMAFVPLAGSLLIGTSALNLTSALTSSKFLALPSVPLIGTALAAVVGEFGLYREPLDPLFPKKTSGDVIAVRHASGETKRRIIISGHTDSAPEWTYTYKLGSKGVTTVVIAALAGLLYDMAATGICLGSKNENLARKMALGGAAMTPIFSLLYAFTNNKRFVDGASDDLSGCFVGNSVMKFLADNDIRLENTEIMVLLTGGEECGLRGTTAFFKNHPEILNDGVETMFAGFDTVRDEDFMMIYKADLNGLVKNDMRCCKLQQEAAKKCGLDVPLGTIPLGSTDAAAASRCGCPATSFVAMDPAPARYYHTRLDVADNIKPSTISKGVEIALQTIADFDEKGLG